MLPFSLGRFRMYAGLVRLQCIGRSLADLASETAVSISNFPRSRDDIDGRSPIAKSPGVFALCTECEGRVASWLENDAWLFIQASPSTRGGAK